MLIFSLLIFILGLFVGSFLNVFVDRTKNGESFIKGRSHCDNCNKDIAWYDLIPVFSFLFLKGKCRYCKKSLSFYYPIVEVSTGVLFLSTVFFLNLGSEFSFLMMYWLLLASFLLITFFIDLKYGIIPDKIIYPAVLMASIFILIVSPHAFLYYLLCGLGAAIFMYLLSFWGMGGGDIKLSFLMGIVLGFPKIILALYLAFLTGAVAGVILILWRKKKLRGSTIPFGPFLVLGTFLSLFFWEFFIKLLPIF